MKAARTMPTAEPFFIPGGEIGCLLLHGFTGTPKEMRMLADSLAQKNYTILAPRLAGHATQVEDITRTHWEDWLCSVEDGINLLKDCTQKQVVMGLSMGGILALIAAARYDLAGVVSFSTPCRLPGDPRAKYLPVLKYFIRTVSKGKPDWRNMEAAKDHAHYPYYPTPAILQLKELIDVMQAELVNVTIPALFVQSRQDQGIPAGSLDYLYAQVASTDKIKFWVENSGHVIIREPERELIFTEVKSFVKRITAAA
jgi:carboxylesterase